MATVEIRGLIGKLNSYCKQKLEAAAGACVNYSHYEVSIEHYLLKLIEAPDADMQQILTHYDIDVGRLEKQLQAVIDKAPSGNTRKPVFSQLLIELIEEAWLWVSVDMNAQHVRSGALMVTLVNRASRYILEEYYQHIKRISPENLKQNFLDIVERSIEKEISTPGSSENQARPSISGEQSALAQFATNFTEQARQGKIDPVFGRETEIRQMIDILARRRKNNPIVVGEPGVGKTAVVEGLACKIVEGDVPEVLAKVEVHALDIGLLQAGASVKGQFEQRLKNVIEEVKASTKPLIVFIDEAHTLIGAGGAAGGGDAANLLKPALARGEFRTIAATTWSEYKKYFEKDAALARRFQVVKIEEPSVDDAVLIMRGLRLNYENAHQVYIRDDAVVATAELAARYISGRQLPDKSVDLLDTACARVKIGLTSKPAELDQYEKQKATLNRELEALTRDIDTGQIEGSERIAELTQQLTDVQQKMDALAQRWQQEKQCAEQIVAARKQLLDLAPNDESAESLASEAQVIKQQLDEMLAELKAIQQDKPLINMEVNVDTVGRVVSDWTGIPVGDMVKDEAAVVLDFDNALSQRIKGQSYAIRMIAERVRAAKAGLDNPKTPLGVFLLVGPSGVGKTECGLAMADLLFGGERFVVSINMSEFQEKHTVSRLVGSPPGYVGYGEGGVLTEAVRQRPYSIVLLDEVEKADLEVMNLFYQVFDKGVLSDGEGREIDFKNTIVILTSNLATDIIAQKGVGEFALSPDQLSEAIRPVLSRHFRPALLARMEVIPFFPLPKEAMQDIVVLKMNKLVERLYSSQKMHLSYDEAVISQIADRCTEVETGARNIDFIINKTLLPKISTEILTNLAEEKQYENLHIAVSEEDDFVYQFS